MMTRHRQRRRKKGEGGKKALLDLVLYLASEEIRRGEEEGRRG